MEFAVAVINVGLSEYNESLDMNDSSITAKYKVECDALMDVMAARDAVAALPVPAGYWIWKIASKPSDINPLFIEVSIEYKIPSIPFPGDDPNPLLRPSVLTSSYDEYTEAYFKDSKNNPVLNSAFDRFENFPIRRMGNLLLQITKNFAAFPAVAYDQIKYTRNQDNVTIKGTIYAAETLLFLPATVSEMTEQIQGTQYHYFATTFRLLADYEKHLDKIEDRGYNEYKEGKPVLINMTYAGNEIKSPWPLDGSGQKKPKPSDEPPIITFTPYPLAAWGIDFS